MGVIDWLKQTASNVTNGAKWLGDKIGGGISWVKNNVAQPVANFAKNIPFVGAAAEAAQPILDFAGKAGDALQGRGSIGMDDFTKAANAVPNTIMAAKGARSGVEGALQNARRRLRY